MGQNHGLPALTNGSAAPQGQSSGPAPTRRALLRGLGGIGALVALSPLLEACTSAPAKRSFSSADGDALATPIERLNWTLGSPVTSLDVATGADNSSFTAMSLGLQGLVSIDKDLRLQPLLAESWEQRDELTYVYLVRDKVTFWDGSPLTVDDVVYSLGRHMDPATKSQIAFTYAHVASIKATGEREVTIKMKRPDPLFQYIPMLSFVTSKEFSTKQGASLGVAGAKVRTMGTGPYRITKYDGDSVEAEIYDGYWGEKPRVKKVVLDTVEAPDTRLLALKSKGSDGTFAVPVDALPQWQGLDEVNVQSSAPMAVFFLSMDVTKAPWDDVHVRRALAHCVDRAGYVNAFLGAAGEPASALVTPPAWSGLATKEEVGAVYGSLPDYAYSVEEARAALAQSSVPDGFAADINCPDSSPSMKKALVSLSETARQVGIDITVHEVPKAQYLADDVYGHKKPLVAMFLNPNFPDPSDFLSLVYPSANAVPNALNTAHFKNSRVDWLLEKQAAERDPARRVELIRELLQISAEELPYIPVWWQSVPLALSADYVYDGFNALYYYQNWASSVGSRAT